MKYAFHRYCSRLKESAPFSSRVATAGLLVVGLDACALGPESELVDRGEDADATTAVAPPPAREDRAVASKAAALGATRSTTTTAAPEGAARCSDRTTELVVSVELPPANDEAYFREKILFDADARVRLHDRGFAEACLLEPGDAVDMKDGSVGKVTAVARRPRKKAPPKGTKAERVLMTSEHVVTRLVHLHTQTSDLDTTPNHPFFVRGRGFVPAGELRVGDPLVTETGAEAPLLSTDTKRVAPTPVFNMVVEDKHTYYAGGLLVHNGGADGNPCGVDAVTQRGHASKPSNASVATSVSVATTALGDDFEKFMLDDVGATVDTVRALHAESNKALSARFSALAESALFDSAWSAR
ncbi:hypothetical protein EON77_07310, partial [bacterium]